MTWREVISKGKEYLRQKGVPDADSAAECLAARLLACGRGFLVDSAEKEVSEGQLAAMRRGMKRLIAGEPLQYILAEWDFRTLTLKCDRRALIPRPETEELVTRVLKFLKGRENPVVVDVGTGTGAIILSIAKEFPGKGIFIGTDVSPEAIALANENAELCGLTDRVVLEQADGLDEFDEPEMFDVIVSNPPYIPTAVCETLDPRVKDFEPRLALDGGAEGLDFYNRYLDDAMNLLKPNGAVFFEIGDGQGAALAARMREYGFTDIRIEKDYSGLERYASALLK